MRGHDGNKENEDATCAEDSVAANYSHASLGARLSHNREAAGREGGGSHSLLSAES